MKFHTDKEQTVMSSALYTLLAELRKRRNFDAQHYVDAKIRVVNDYYRASHLTSSVVAVSGGIDSAVVLSLIVAASKAPQSPIKKIIPVTLPVFKSVYTTNQDEATSRAKEVILQNGLEPITYDLTKTYEALKETIDTAYGVVGEPWAAGQLVSYLRTPALYYTTSLLTQQETSGLLCGTTNRDEGAYLGFVGKASDGIVDIQVISDLHKSEVRNVAKLLHVPQSILGAVPTGDMFDGRVDEEVFGTSYDFVELFLLLKSLDDAELRNALFASLDAESKKQYDHLASKLEDLHRYNGHKYAVGSPAVHLDVLESGVPGGWIYGYEKIEEQPKGESFFVNRFFFSENVSKKLQRNSPVAPPERKELSHGLVLNFQELLHENEKEILLSEAAEHGYKPVGVDGYAKNYKHGDKIGSYRASVFSPDFARVLWDRLSPHLDNPRIFSEEPSTDIDASQVWRPIGVSPLFRYIRYDAGGLLVPHYDAPYIISQKQRTLMSLVLYLKQQDITGGITRFIRDPQVEKPFNTRNFQDWTRVAKDEEILFSVEPQEGHALCFDHRLLHDSSEIKGSGEKIIIRTDIVFARCGA